MALIELHKEYLTIAELMTRWKQTIYDMQYLAEQGEVKIYVRPMAIEAAFAPPGAYSALEKLKHCPLNPIDIHRLFDAQDGHIPVSRFQGLKRPPKRQIRIGFGDMVVLTADVEQFEKEHGGEAFVLLSPDYREFIIRGEMLRLGDKQAVVAKHLHGRLHTANPWVHGKDLMKLAGSESWRIQNLFGRNKNWRAAIKSDGRGYYKFNL